MFHYRPGGKTISKNVLNRCQRKHGQNGQDQENHQINRQGVQNPTDQPVEVFGHAFKPEIVQKDPDKACHEPADEENKNKGHRCIVGLI